LQPRVAHASGPCNNLPYMPLFLHPRPVLERPFLQEAEPRDLLADLCMADRANRELVTSHGFAEVAARLIAATHSLNYEVLHGASPTGLMLMGAMFATRSVLRPWEPGEAEDVLIVDGYVAGFAGISASADALRSVGAVVSGALVIDVVADCTEWAVPGGLRSVKRLEEVIPVWDSEPAVARLSRDESTVGGISPA
jgi:hypothetical protein